MFSTGLLCFAPSDPHLGIRHTPSDDPRVLSIPLSCRSVSCSAVDSLTQIAAVFPFITFLTQHFALEALRQIKAWIRIRGFGHPLGLTRTL